MMSWTLERCRALIAIADVAPIVGRRDCGHLLFTSQSYKYILKNLINTLYSNLMSVKFLGWGGRCNVGHWVMMMGC